jgi:hypothetical protein
MGNDKNDQLRSEILNYALNLEHNVDLLLIAYLSIEKPNRKAISNKSGNLSFKNKLDLLFDLDILTKQEYDKLLLLMEFRNQFIHNIECNSFVCAVEILGSDRGKKLLYFSDIDENINIENRYHRGFTKLYGKSLKLFVDKIDERKQVIEERHKMLVSPIELQIFFINKYFNTLKKIIEVFEVHNSYSPEMIKLFDQLNETIMNEVNMVMESEAYIELLKTTKCLYVDDKIKEYFKI